MFTFQVIYDISDEGKPELINYVKNLTNIGIHIVETVETREKITGRLSESHNLYFYHRRSRMVNMW